MKTFTISAALALFAALAQAAPAPAQVEARYWSGFEAQVTFIGAADAKFSLSIPADGRLITICMSPSSLPFPARATFRLVSSPLLPHP